MWPWEHAAFGYLCYSLLVRWLTGESPGRAGAYAVAFGALFPDLVDKPLSWAFAVFPSGYAVGHSVFVAVLLAAVVVPLAHEAGHLGAGLGFVVGQFSHLVGDIVYPVVFGEGLAPTVVLWPLVHQPGYAVQYGLVDRFLLYLVRFLSLLSQPTARGLLVLELTFMLGVAALWIADGTPGLPAR